MAMDFVVRGNYKDGGLNKGLSSTYSSMQKIEKQADKCSRSFDGLQKVAGNTQFGQFAGRTKSMLESFKALGPAVAIAAVGIKGLSTALKNAYEQSEELQSNWAALKSNFQDLANAEEYENTAFGRFWGKLKQDLADATAGLNALLFGEEKATASMMAEAQIRRINHEMDKWRRYGEVVGKDDPKTEVYANQARGSLYRGLEAMLKSHDIEVQWEWGNGGKELLKAYVDNYTKFSDAEIQKIELFRKYINELNGKASAAPSAKATTAAKTATAKTDLFNYETGVARKSELQRKLDEINETFLESGSKDYQAEKDILTEMKVIEERILEYQGLSARANNPAVQFDIPSARPASPVALSSGYVEPQEIKEAIDYTEVYVDVVNNLASAFDSLGSIMGDDTPFAAFLSSLGAVSNGIASMVQQYASLAAAATAAGAMKSGESLPWPYNLAAIASYVATALSTIAQIKSSIGRFYNGGIVEGSGFGDMTLARVSPGEMILNRREQGNLWDLLDRGSGENIPNSITLKVRGEDLVTTINNYQRRINL